MEQSSPPAAPWGTPLPQQGSQERDGPVVKAVRKESSQSLLCPRFPIASHRFSGTVSFTLVPLAHSCRPVKAGTFHLVSSKAKGHQHGHCVLPSFCPFWQVGSPSKGQVSPVASPCHPEPGQTQRPAPSSAVSGDGIASPPPPNPQVEPHSPSGREGRPTTALCSAVSTSAHTHRSESCSKGRPSTALTSAANSSTTQSLGKIQGSKRCH